MLLKSLSDREAVRLSEFLNSPYNNKNKRIISLFNVLRSNSPSFDITGLSIEKIYVKVFSDIKTAKYDDVAMRSVISDLTMAVLQFLSIERFISEPFSIHENILKELSGRRLNALFSKQLKRVRNEIKADVFRGEDDFYRHFILEDIEFSYEQFNDMLSISKSDHVGTSAVYLYLFCIVRAAKSLNFYSLQNQHNIAATHDPFVEIIAGRKDNAAILSSFKAMPICNKIAEVYLSMFDALYEPLSDSAYIEFKKAVTLNEKLFSSLELYGLYATLTNCCVRRIDIGLDKYRQECLAVYKIMLSKQLFEAYPGSFTVASYTAIVNTALSSGDVSFADQFIDKYGKHLNPEEAEGIPEFCKAQVHFAQQQFRECLQYLSLSSSRFANIKFHLKYLQLKCYYELDELDALMFVTDSFEHFLRKNKYVRGDFKTQYLNFVRVLKLLSKFKTNHKSSDLLKAEDIILEGKTAGSKWLKEKLELLSG